MFKTLHVSASERNNKQRIKKEFVSFPLPYSILFTIKRFQSYKSLIMCFSNKLRLQQHNIETISLISRECRGRRQENTFVFK